MKTLDKSEQGLHAREYAMKICEDFAIPAGRTNMESVLVAIEAVAKSRIFRGRPRATEEAFLWLHRRVAVAEDQGAKITFAWFRDAEYKAVSRPEGARGDYNSCDGLCKSRHGKGYDYNDVRWVMLHYFNDVKGGGNRTADSFFNELDTKREGGPPEWKR